MTNRSLHDAIQDDFTWKILCEELFKWDSSQPRPVCTWKRYYERNPSVPVAYPTIESALLALSDAKTTRDRRGRLLEPVVSQPSDNVTIWLLPGVYEQSLALHIQALAFTTTSLYKPIFTKRANRTASEGDTRKCCVALLHHTRGLDIWDGNSAILVESIKSVPLLGTFWDLGFAFGLTRSKLILERAEITSTSSRGVVATRGAHVCIVDSLIHNCAATGIYGAGRSTRLVIQKCDVLYNGIGNRRTKGIPRGYSGRYIEESKAMIHDCNVCCNTSSGITIINDTAADVKMTHTDLLSNGSKSVEFPRGAVLPSYDRTNRIAVVGALVPRSMVLRHKGCDAKKDVFDFISR